MKKELIELCSAAMEHSNEMSAFWSRQATLAQEASAMPSVVTSLFSASEAAHRDADFWNAQYIKLKEDYKE